MVLKSAIKQTIHLIHGNRTRLSSMIEYLNTAGGEGFRTATIPVAAAEAEMEVRQEARRLVIRILQSELQSLMIKLLKVSLISSLKNLIQPSSRTSRAIHQPMFTIRLREIHLQLT